MERSDDPQAEDAAAGMTWWNHQTDRARAIWLQRAGSAVPGDAWRLLKNNLGIAYEVGVQEAQELASGFGDEVPAEKVVRKLARHLELDDVLVVQGDDGKLRCERIRDIRLSSGTLTVRSGPVRHRTRACIPDAYVDVLRR